MIIAEPFSFIRIYSEFQVAHECFHFTYFSGNAGRRIKFGWATRRRRDDDMRECVLVCGDVVSASTSNYAGNEFVFHSNG